MNNEDIEKDENIVEEQSVTDEIEESDDLDNETFTYSVNNTNNNQYDDKKSFLYIIVGVIILISIILLLVLFVNKSSKSFSYSSIEEKMVSAAKSYYDKNNSSLPSMDGSSISVSSDTLIQNSFMKPFSEMVDESVSCSGNVNVYKNGEEYVYFPYLDCGEVYVSKKLSNEIINNVVTSGDGVYKVSDEYVFRGETPNNYVSFSGKAWRILRVNSDGSIKLLYAEKKVDRNVWDDRYNSEKGSYVGINDFRISRISEFLKSSYENNSYVSADDKKLLVKHDWCIGSVSSNDDLISSLNLCNDVYNDYIGLLNIDEVLITSLAPNCDSLYDVECTNYNYFFNINTGWTLNSSNDKTYSVFNSNSGMVYTNNASNSNNVRPVININGDVLYKSGTGTADDPYIIGE